MPTLASTVVDEWNRILLTDHHALRLKEIEQVCVTPQSANDIVPVLFPRELDTHQLTFALGEALAHLHFLWYSGKLKRVEQADGIIRFVIGDDGDLAINGH